MKYIKNYADQAAYDADQTRPTDASVVSLIQASKNVRYNGVNVVAEVDYASKGDTVIFDTVDGRTKVVKLGTLVPPLVERYIICGTVSKVDEAYVWMVPNQSLTGQWGSPKKIVMSGFVPGDITISINSIQTAVISFLSTDSLADLASKIQNAIQAVMTTHPTGWTASAHATYIVVQQNSYTPNVTSFTCSDGGVTVSILGNLNYQTATSGLLANNTLIYRKDGSSTSWAGGHFEKFLGYYSVNGEDVTGRDVGVGNVIKESRFNEIDNPALVAYYGTYRNYVADKTARHPYGKGIMADQSGQVNTRILASDTFVDHDGVIVPGFPAAATANGFGIDNTPFLAGQWWLPSAPEFLEIIEGITYGYSQYPLDPISRGLRDAGGTYINPGANHWTSSECSGNYAWRYTGTYGTIYARNKFNVYSVRPVTRFSKKLSI